MLSYNVANIEYYVYFNRNEIIVAKHAMPMGINYFHDRNEHYGGGDLGMEPLSY